MIAYIALFSALLSWLTALACGSTWVTSFIARFFKISTEVVYLQHWHGWCHMNLLPSWRVLCTLYNHAPCHFMQNHIRKVYACLAVTCHLHVWQNDQDLLRATAVTRGWNGYRNKSQHRRLTLEKNLVPPLLHGFEPATFQSRVRRSNHWAIVICANYWLFWLGCLLLIVFCAEQWASFLLVRNCDCDLCEVTLCGWQDKSKN